MSLEMFEIMDLNKNELLLARDNTRRDIIELEIRLKCLNIQHEKIMCRIEKLDSEEKL